MSIPETKSVSETLNTLLEHHELNDFLETVIRFISLASKLKNDILLVQPARVSATEPPEVLPPTIVAFLASTCEMPPADVRHCWDALKGTVWNRPNLLLDQSEGAFAAHGISRGLCMILHCWFVRC